MKTRRVGDHALLVLVEDAPGALAVRDLVLRLAADGGPDALPMPVDVVPAARTVLLDGLPGPASVHRWQDRLAHALPEQSEPLAPERETRQLTLDVRYDGADLATVAQAWGCSVQALVDRHTTVDFLVAFCGFAPGFAYCVPTQPLPSVPRRPAPRERVPAGSVALAGEYCGVYPTEMPGGWQLLGRTAALLFDPEREQPALLVPGDTVRFRNVA
jgi:KipI family sensor histidine kinase inhibitor